MKEYYIIFKRGKKAIPISENKIPEKTFNSLIKTHRKGDKRTEEINGWKITTYYFMNFNLEEIEITEEYL